jgi:hypothetical protein
MIVVFLIKLLFYLTHQGCLVSLALMYSGKLGFINRVLHSVFHV